MDKFREKVTSRGTADCPLSRYNLTRVDSGATFSSIHWHPEAEILYMVKGAIRVRAGKQIFELLPGQIAFIPSGQLHSMHSIAPNSNYHALVFSLELLQLPESHFFQKELIAPLRAGTLRFPYVLFPSDEPYDVVSKALNRICQCPKNDAKYKKIVFVSMVKVFIAMMDSLEAGSTNLMQKSNDCLKICLKYMEDHYSEHLSLQDIANRVHLHPNYLCAIFKDYTGQTVFQHLIQLRVEKAAQLLRSQNISVAEAASACGFESNGFFAKKFKSIMGESPKAYSLRHQ